MLGDQTCPDEVDWLETLSEPSDGERTVTTTAVASVDEIASLPHGEDQIAYETEVATGAGGHQYAGGANGLVELTAWNRV